jgi:outer membrane protein
MLLLRLAGVLLLGAVPALLPAQGGAPTAGPPPAPSPVAQPAAAPSAAAPSAPVGRPITLDEAVALARRANPAAIQARGQVRASSAAVRSAYASFIPNLSLNASSTEQSPATPRVNPTTGELLTGRWATTEGFSANVDLFDGLRRFHDVRTARAQQNAALSGEDAQAFSIAEQVKVQFYAALAAQESEAAARAQLAQAEAQLRLSVARVLASTATRSDSLRARIQVAQAQLALLQSQNDRRSADASLTRLVGAPTLVSATPAGLVDDATAAVDSAQITQLAFAGPAVRQAEANVAAARAARRASRSPYYPTLGVSYARNRVGSSETFDPTPDDFRYSGQLRFSVSLPLFNQLTRERNVVQADVAEDDATASLRDARLAAQEGLVQSLGALRTAQQQILTQSGAVVAAEEDLRVQQQRYQLGVSTVLDVLTSQTQLTQARLGLVQARFAARVARARLETLVGRDL